MPDKIDQLYEALRKDGAVTKSRDNFRNYVLASGDEGVQNRKALYEALKADGAVTSPTQDEFERRLGISGTQQPTAPPTTTAPNALKQQDAAASGGNKGTILGGTGNIGNLTGAALGGAIGALAGGGYVMDKDGKVVAQAAPVQQQKQQVKQQPTQQPAQQPTAQPQVQAQVKAAPQQVKQQPAPQATAPKVKPQPQIGEGIFMPLMKNPDSLNLRNTEAFKKGWLSSPKYDKNKRFKEARAAGYKAQGAKFDKMTDAQLVAAMREEEKKLDGSTSPQALQASMNVTYIETLMAAREWGLGSVSNLNALPHMSDYKQVRSQFNKNGLVDKYEKNLKTNIDDNPLLTIGWEKIESAYMRDKQNGSVKGITDYINQALEDPKVFEEFGAYVTARMKVKSKRWNDAVREAVLDFAARVGQDPETFGKLVEQSYTDRNEYYTMLEEIGAMWKDVNASARVDAYNNTNRAFAGAPSTAQAMQGLFEEANYRRSDPVGTLVNRLLREAPNAKSWLSKRAAGYIKDGVAKDYKTAERMARRDFESIVVGKLVDMGMPKSDTGYVLATGLLNSTAGLLTRTITTGLSGKNGGKYDQIAQQELQQYGQTKASSGARVAAAVAPLAVDIVTGVGFTGPSALGQGTKNLFTKGMAQAGKRAYGLTTKAAIRRVEQNAGVRFIGSGLSGAVNFGTYTGRNTLLQQYAQTGQVDVVEAGKEGGKAAANGFVFGVVGEGMGALTNGWTGGKALLGEGATVVVEGTTFTALDAMWGDEPITKETIAKNFGMGIAGRVGHLPTYVKNVTARYRGEVGPVKKVRLSDESYNALKGEYPVISEMLHDQSVITDISKLMKQGAPYGKKSKSKALTVYDPTLAEGETSLWEQMGKELDAMKGDSRVPWEVVRMADWVLNGTVMPEPMVMGSGVRQKEDGKYEGVVLDQNGRTITRYDLGKDEKKAGKWQSSMNDVALRNQAIVAEGLARNKSISDALLESVKGMDIVSEDGRKLSPEEITGRFVELYNKMQSGETLSVKESELFNQVMEGAEKAHPELDIVNQVKIEIKEQRGIDIDEVMKKKPSKLTQEEKQALGYFLNEITGPDIMGAEGTEIGATPATEEPYKLKGPDTGAVDELARSAMVVDSRVFTEEAGGDGMVHPATLKGEGGAGYIVSGRVLTTADGQIDLDNSDSDIIIVDENGEKRMIDIHEIAELGDILDPAELKQVAANEMLGANTPQGIEVGGRYEVSDDAGTHEVEVLRDNGNGSVEISVDGEQHTMGVEQLKQMLGIVEGDTSETLSPTTGTAQGDDNILNADNTLTPDNEMVEADVDAGESGVSLRDKAAAYVDAYFPDVKGEEREGFIEQLVAQNDFENTVRFDKEDGVNLDRVAKYEEAVNKLEEAAATENDGGEPSTAVERYRLADDIDENAIAEAGFSDNDVRYVADYLNGDLNEVELLNALGINNTSILTDAQIKSWVDSIVDRASEFLTDKPVESGDVRVESDEVPADAGTTLTPTPQPEAADATEVEATTEPMPLLDDGNPNYAGTTPERGRQYIYDESGLDKGEADAYVSANLASAEKDLDKIKKKPPKMGTNLVKYQKDKADWESRMQEAQSNVDYWNKVRASQADYEAEQAKARKAADAKVRAQAVVDEQARQAAELAKQQEQAERGAGAVHPAIAEKWNNAPKIEGYKDEVVLANGERVPGTYYLVESGAVTPSHNASREFEKYEGFPVDENGNTINDRDYERDKDAQNITRSIADKYDSRALQTPVIVSKDGVVLSGNGRTMAGELAASNNTDGAYIEHLKNYGRKYGFSPEQVTSMKHPRAVFVPDADMPYTTDTFAKFNAQEMKGQSKTEQAVKLGKVVDDATFNQIVRAINDHETLGDFYNNTRAATEAINALRKAGALNEMQYAEMFDGDAVSGTGRQIIENMLIGKAFEGNPDVIRQLTEIKSLRQSVVTALNEISTNKALGKDYSLENELAQAVDLAYKARKAGFQENERVSPYATQLNLFPFEDGETVADYNNVAVLELADLMNDKRPTQLKKKLQDYNQQSAESAAGQMDIFAGGVKEKKEIIKTILNTLHNGETEETSRPEQRGSVADERGGEASLQENGAVGQPEQGESNIQGLESYSEDELRVIVEEHVRSAIADADMDAEITGIRFIGSRTTGTARADSDLDVLVEYQGTAHEDSLFNVLNDEDNRLVIDGITVDINPITPGKSGTIEEFMRRNAGYKKETAVQAQIALAEQQTETSPSEAQKEAGNYKKGHVKIDGFDISIEQPKGSVRSGVDASGKSWRQKMNNTYGYIRGTEGVDGDHIDVFLSDDPSQGDVFVVDQVNNDGSFDEHKVMYGFNSEEEARQAYLSNYEDGWQGLGAITAVSKDEFKKWIGSSHRKTKPFVEYKNVKVEGAQAGTMRQPTGQKVEGATHPVSAAKSSQKSELAEAPKERIDDVGEKIEGAKKDLAQKMGERINLDADTFPKMFPKYDLKQLISQGLDPSLAVMTKMLRQMAQADYKHYSKKRMYGKNYALRAARFYAAYAKQVLEAGDSNVDFKSEGLGFTDYGKQFVELNKRLFEELHKKLGDDIFDLDLTGVKMQPISQKEGTTWYRRNQETGESEPYNPAYAFIGPRGQSYYEANELDKALQEGVEQVSKSIDYKKTHPYKLGHYYKPGVKNSDYVGVKLGGKVVPLTEPMTSSEVRKYMSEHNAELQAKAAQLDEQRKLDKKKGGTGEGRWKPELTLGGGRPRVGAERRGGVDIEAEEFMKSFGFRGVQFGNYVTQRERQRFLNEAYDALMDMAELLGISPRAIAIDGRLGFAIGARGGGKANAHYEPKENVINLTKSKGAGSLAHEWFHALDYYFNRGNKKPTASTANKSTEQFPASTRNEMRKAFLDLMSAIKNSDYYNRSVALEQKLHPQQLGEGYYDKPTELGARAFQDYVVRKLTDQGKINDFLSSFTSEKDWNGEPENYPYPVGAEAEKIDEKFDALFDAMQERTDEEGNTILYHLGKDNEVLTDTEVALRDGLVDVLRSAGIEVVTDEAEGQRVLDAANRAADVLDEMKKRNQQQETALPEDESSFKGTAISSADGAKIQQIVDTSKDLPGKIREMRAWHGSGADFDAFDHGHMGEGEGAQAYGWGTYVTQVEGIARSYAEVNAKKPPYLSVAKRHRNTAYENFINSRNAVESCKRDIENYEKRITANKEYIEELEDSRAYILKEHGESSVELENWDFLGQEMLSQVREEIEADKKRIASSREYLRNLEKMLPYLESEYEKAKAEVLRLDAMTKRYLYEVEIPDNDGTNYLPFDKPLTDEQLEGIALAGRQSKEFAENFDLRNDPLAWAKVNEKSRRGDNVYSTLSNMLGARKASELLSQAGFVGIEYPAQYRSGGRSDGAKNYVIFDEGDLKINSKAQFFRTDSGEVYGFVSDGKIYIDPRVASAETPVHEYSHLWADALKRANPEAWERLKETMLGAKDVLEHVKRLYPELEGDELLGEVFSHYSGKRGAERLRADMEREMKNAEDVFAKARVARVFDIIRRALSRFWEMARDLFAGKNSMLNGMRAEDFADMAMADMLRGFDPRGVEKEIALNETHYHKVTDKAELERLNNEPTVVRYRAMQMIDGKLYPPMSAEVKGELREPTEIGVWERSDERPDLVDKNGKFKLQKGKRFKENKEGQGDTPAAYNPYFHTSTSMMNDQFTAAYVRPELVVVKVEIPESELSSGYKAEKAKDAVGNIPWHSGPVNSALPKERQRTVTLSRYCKVTGVVPDAEVADAIARQLDGLDVAVPYNVVTPNVRAELEARGVKISATPSGSVTRDINGELINRGEAMVANEGEVLYEPSARTTGPDIEIVNSRFNEELQKQIDGTLPKGHVYKLGKPSAILRSAGIPELPIELVASRLVDKSMQENHPYDLSEVEDLPQSIHTPLAVFRSATHIGSYVILTELRHGNRNFVAAIETNRQLGKLLVNSIRSVHPRNGMNVVNWINEGLAEYVHPEFEDKWLTPFKNELRSKPQYNSADVRTQLKDAAKIVKDFENPSIGAEKVTRERGFSYRSGSGDVIKFESHAEQLSLFGGVEQSNKRVIEQAKREERAKAVAAMSDAELLKEMQRDIAEFEKLGRGDWGIQTACTDEYDRRHIKEYNAECERVRTMLDENNVSIEEAEDMLCNAIYSWRDGYATADRSKLLAQFDTLNDYYAEKTDERDNADLYQEVESEQAISEADARNTETPTQQEVAPTTQQTEPAKPKKAAFDPSAIKLRKLKSGETCHVERRYQESGGFDFTGSEIIKDDADLAYIFRNLENSAIENTFLVLIKNGKATILHTGMGSYAASVGHVGAGLLAASKLKPDHVIFVHNHPSGRLEPSVQDVAMQTRAKKMFGEGVVREAIIIDITSGEYCTFDDGPYTNTEVKKRPTEVENEIPYKTYSFSQYVFDKDYKPGTTMQITDANKAAAFISSHRLGERDKMSLIVMSRSKYVTANVFLPWTTLDGVDIEKAATTIAKYIHQMGGESGIVYGSATIDRNILDPLSREIERREVHLDDFITVEGRSAQQEGVLEDEVKYEAVPRNTEQQPTEVAEDGVGYGEADDSGISDEELAGYDAGRYSFAESITQGLVDLALKNAHDQQLRLNAMREFGGNLAKLRKIMNKQKAYDKGTVDDIVRLARMVMGSGFFKDMSAYEVKRLLAAIKKGVGAEDLTPIANNVVDMLVQHQLRESKNMLHKLMQVRGRKVDARGVEVQAGLDIDGQRMMSALKDGMSLGENGLLTRINDCENRLGSEDEVIRKNAMSEYQGLMLAKEYHDNILSGEEEEIVLRNEKRQEQEKIYDFRREPVLDDDGNAIINQDGSVRTVERKTLKPQFKNNVTDENKQLRRNTEAAIERIEQSIRESRMERVTSYIDFMSDVAGDVRASRERAAEWRAEQQQRVDEIHHNANSDLEGVPVQSQVKLPEGGLLAFNSNNDIVRLLFQPLATFEKMLRFFGRKAHNGEGYLFNRFMRGWVDCSDKEWRSKRAAHEELDAKVNELFGKKAKRWSDLYKVERNKKHPGIPVEYWDNGERVQETMSQGEALSLVVWSKQKDAEAGLRRMGISEEDIETIKNNLDPKFLQLAEWVVEEFLPKRREYYNEVHERMFGAPMAAIEHYFPIVRNSRDVEKPSDITERDLGETKPSTITGNIIKRQRTAATLDVHTDFFDHLLKHLDDMENWAAWAEFNRDINTLRNYKRFKNRVLNMHSVEYGSGKDLWKAFDDACAIAAGVYHPSTKRGSGDNLAVNIAKGVTGAKIAFRFYTAAKQLLSLPAFWNGDAGLKELAKWENPVGAIIAWNWAMKNLPGFSKRWQSRQVGDVRLMDTDSDYAFWRNNMIRALSRGGMWANALVDGMTVAMGARSVYETKKKRYLRNGYSEEQAEKRAMQDAAISYNSSQQSSEDAFLSSLQLDRTWWSTLMTVFRSASMGYQRRLTTGLRNLKNRTKKGYKAESIAFMKKQMERDGVDEATAEKAAKRTYRWGGLRSMADVFVYGFVLPFFWNLGPYALYLLMGDDDDEKKDMLKDASVHSLFGPIEGFTGGNAMSEIGNTYAGYLMSDNDKSLLNALRYHDYLSMPLGSDLQQIFNEAGNDSMAAWTDAFNLLVQAGIGINPETFTDTWVAIADACDGDPQTTKEFALCFMRVMQVPQTQTDKLFIDELGMTAKDAQKLNAMEMADRYARYKKFRNAPLLNWAYSPDESQKVAEKYRKRFLDNMQERMEHMDNEQLGWNFENPNDSERRKAVGKVYAKGKGVQDSAGKKPAGNWKPETRRSQLKYQRLRDYNDLAEDVLLDVAIDQAKNRGDGETEKALRDAKKELTEIKRGKHTKTIDINGLGDGSADDDKAIMEELRARRKEILQEYGII